VDRPDLGQVVRTSTTCLFYLTKLFFSLISLAGGVPYEQQLDHKQGDGYHHVNNNHLDIHHQVEK
jgi:hypothetical protein